METREELKAKAIELLNEPVALAAAIAQTTGMGAEEVFNKESQMKLMAGKYFAEALFGEEIIIDDENGFMFKTDAEVVPEGVC